MPGLDDALRAASAATEPTEVKYDGRVFRVLPPMMWRQSAMAAIREGRFNDWARACFVNDTTTEKGKPVGADDGQAFIDADLTNAQVVEFFAAYADAAGQSPGE